MIIPYALCIETLMAELSMDLKTLKYLSPGPLQRKFTNPSGGNIIQGRELGL